MWHSPAARVVVRQVKCPETHRDEQLFDYARHPPKSHNLIDLTCCSKIKERTTTKTAASQGGAQPEAEREPTVEEELATPLFELAAPLI